MQDVDIGNSPQTMIEISVGWIRVDFVFRRKPGTCDMYLDLSRLCVDFEKGGLFFRQLLFPYVVCFAKIRFASECPWESSARPKGGHVEVQVGFTEGGNHTFFVLSGRFEFLDFMVSKHLRAIDSSFKFDGKMKSELQW